MNDMTPIQKSSPLERFSMGEISRATMERLYGKNISFGDALLLLHEAKLPLPRRPVRRDSGGVALLKELIERAGGV
jgi:ABC-type transporter Mla MlaB component